VNACVKQKFKILLLLAQELPYKVRKPKTCLKPWQQISLRYHIFPGGLNSNLSIANDCFWHFAELNVEVNAKDICAFLLAGLYVYWLNRRVLKTKHGFVECYLPLAHMFYPVVISRLDLALVGYFLLLELLQGYLRIVL